MTKPLIGVTAFHYTNPQGYPYQGLSEGYIARLLEVEAVPMIIPVGLPPAALSALLARLDGVLLSGGGDIDPACYGSPMHPRVAEVDTQRDQMEINLLKDLIKLGMPFFGICRGLQVINVALGGSLYEDIADQYNAEIIHNCYPTHPRDYLAHSVSIEANSYLADILEVLSIQVNSMHHQAVRQAAAGVVVTASAPDGVIEALEIPDHPFGLAVQWHPECLMEDAATRRLFNAFRRAAMGYQESKG